MGSAATRQSKSDRLTSRDTERARFAITRVRTADDDRAVMAREVREGLAADPPSLPSKFFYDTHGSALFERITTLPEYYLTRVEDAIHARVAAEIVERARPREWVELGSGLGTKTRRMLDTIALAVDGPKSCILLDVDEAALRSSLAALAAAYPALRARGIAGDFLTDIGAIGPSVGRRMMGFLGGTLGNLHPRRVPAFFAAAAAVLAPGDSFLLGVDLVKDKGRLEAAYNDRTGVTAAFNLNMLEVINRRLGADFEVPVFQHVAFYDSAHDWIEMRLRATRRTVVHIPAAGFERAFDAGDEIRTEISCKYTRRRLEHLLAGTGLLLDAWHSDADAQFAVVLLRRH
jgi:L-histidine N-alpha-methyltransferase